MATPTAYRVEENSPQKINKEIREKTNESISRYKNADRAAISQRLEALDREWDIERAIETEAPTVIALGSVLAAIHDRRWMALSAFGASMLLLHSFQGWYPLLPIFRKMGIRSRKEIAREKEALRVLRGDHQAFIKH